MRPLAPVLAVLTLGAACTGMVVAPGAPDGGDRCVTPGDCIDPACDGRGPCEHGTELTCDDLFDNDADGRVDCRDGDCPCDPVCGDGTCTRQGESCAVCPTDCSCWAPPTLVQAGAGWRYLDDGSDQGTAWAAPTFDATAWASGPAELGYGDGDEATVVSYGADPASKYITTYFRTAFTVADPTAYAALAVDLLRDDGALVYLNGTEVVRSNMPAADVTYQTTASASASCATCWEKTDVAASLLVPGTNVIAAEVHQSSASSSDVSFDLRLVGAPAGDPVCGDGPCEPGETCAGCPGDCGGCPGSWSFFVLGDSRTNVDIFETNVRSMDALDHLGVACVNVGDLTATGSATEWDAHHLALAMGAPDPGVPDDPSGIVRQSHFRTDVSSFGPYVRYLGVLGNHDDGTTGWLDRWNAYLPGQAGLGVNGMDGIYYTLTRDNVLFIFLDSIHPGAAQTAWLRAVLEGPEAQGALFKLVFFHAAVYPCNAKTPFAAGLAWVSLLEEHGVDIAFVADSHTYERTCPMVGGFCVPGGVIYLNSSGAGAPTREVDETRVATVSSDGRTDVYDCSQILERSRSYWYHFCHTNVDGCRLTVSCYGHEYHLTGEPPFDTVTIDRCAP